MIKRNRPGSGLGWPVVVRRDQENRGRAEAPDRKMGDSGSTANPAAARFLGEPRLAFVPKAKPRRTFVRRGRN